MLHLLAPRCVSGAMVLAISLTTAPIYAGDPGAACAAAKRKAAAKKADGKLGCVAKAASKGAAVDPLCISRAETKFASAFTKAEAKGGCLTSNDAGTIEASVDACFATLRGVLAVPGTPPKSLCTAGKLKATSRKLVGKLNCHAKAVKKLLSVSADCLAAAESKYDASFAKAELKGDCLTMNDAGAVETAVDDCVTALVNALPGPTPTTTTTPNTTTTSTTLGPTCDTESPAFAGITAQHNVTRATAVPAPSPALDPLCWSDAVSAHAQAWADTCNFSHDPDLGALSEGQNIYAAAVSVGFPATAAQDAEPLWAGEAADYDYATNGCSGVCGHYTQIVWRSTDFLGCGIKNCTVNTPFGPGFPNWTLVVCNYQPPGNFVGQRPY